MSTATRVPPLTPDELSAEQRQQLGGFADMSYVQVMLRHPQLNATFTPLLAKLVAASDLPARDREVLIFRTVELCNETYESTHHNLIARSAGMTDAEIEAARSGTGCNDFDRMLIMAAEELVSDQFVTDQTWQQLGERYAVAQCMEVVALVGIYVMMAMFIKSYGIELEDDETFQSFAALRQYT